MKEIAIDYLMDNWKGLPPSRISRHLTPPLLDLNLTLLHAARLILASQLGFHTTPWEARPLKKKPQNNFFSKLWSILLKTMESLNKLTTYSVFSPVDVELK